MLWKEIKSWAKEQGYSTSKVEEQYHWHQTENSSNCGIEKSVSKLAKKIFNNITDNKWIDHQNNYDPNK